MQGLVVIVHGTVDSLDDLPEFLTNIRRGHAPSDELVHEVRRRYAAIGGKSPLNDVSREVARKAGEALGIPARFCARLFRPSAKDAITELAALGVTELVVLPLAQHSAPLYLDAVREAAKGVLGEGAKVEGPANWGREAGLVQAFATRVDRALEKLSDDELASTCLVFSAHSLPVAVVRAGDPYEREVLAAAEAIGQKLTRKPGRIVTCFQSQGMSQGPGGRPVEWMGPDLKATMTTAKEAGLSRVVVAPVGFLADHVEILYDLDIEALAWAEELNLQFSRTASLNADDDFVRAACDVVRPFVQSKASPR